MYSPALSIPRKPYNFQSVEKEIVLEGGRLTPGVVRVGATVRRPAKPRSGFVSQLLLELEEAAFSGSPRYLGQDDFGRDTLSYIEGLVPAKLQEFSDEQISDAGVLMRAYHECTRRSTLRGGSPVICHHDAGPNNVVFRDGRPIAFIDFDMAAPGEPLEDVAYMAWLWCISSKATRAPISVQARQVKILVDAYGLLHSDRPNLVTAMLARQAKNADFWRQRLDAADCSSAPETLIRDRIEWSQREYAFTTVHRNEIEEAISVT